MQPDINFIISFFSLLISLIVCVVYIIIAFRPRKAAATQEELADYRCQAEIKCNAKHVQVSSQIAELYNMDRHRTKEITDRLDLINQSLNSWQRGIERQLGNHDGRLENLEH